LVMELQAAGERLLADQPQHEEAEQRDEQQLDARVGPT